MKTNRVISEKKPMDVLMQYIKKLSAADKCEKEIINAQKRLKLS